MTTIILLTKEDINCNPLGSHLEIKTKDGLVINLDYGAAKELLSDIEKWDQSRDAALKNWEAES